MGHKQRLRGHLQRAQNRLRACVREVHQYPQAVALLYDPCAKSCQTTKMSGRGDHVAQRRHHVILLVKQLKVPHTAFVNLFYPIQLSLDEL